MGNLINQKWYTVDQPWGDGTWIVAGNPDPHLGTPVCDCQGLWDDDEEHSQIAAAERASYIVNLHNANLQREHRWEDVIADENGEIPKSEQITATLDRNELETLQRKAGIEV